MCKDYRSFRDLYKTPPVLYLQYKGIAMYVMYTQNYPQMILREH
jgi:hypothetical protein